MITLIYHSRCSRLLEAEKVRVSIPIIEASRFNSFSKISLDLILLVSPGLRFVSNWKFRLRGNSRDVPSPSASYSNFPRLSRMELLLRIKLNPSAQQIQLLGGVWKVVPTLNTLHLLALLCLRVIR